MKRAIGIFLYLLLSWCLLKGWMAREAARSPGIDSLISSLLTAAPKHLSLDLQTPLLSLKLDDSKIEGWISYMGQQHTFSGSGKFDPENLDIALTTSGDAAALVKHLHPKSVFVGGSYVMNARLTGSWSDPKLLTNINLIGGSIDSLSTGAHFGEIFAEIESDGKTVVLLGLTGSDGQGGTIGGRGFLEPSNDNHYALDFELDHASLINLNHISGVFSGKLRIEGNSEATSITGDLKADSASMALDETKAAPQTINVTYINQKHPPPQQARSAAPWPLKLDVDIAAPGNILITDQNLNSEWKARLKLQGTAGSPLLYGSLEMIRGSYMMSGKNVDIKEGKILFDGDPLKGSSLSVIGTLDTNTIIAEALVSGPLTNPSLTLRSNPPLPQTDILSHLIFGRGLADISPQQSNQLKKSLKDLKATSTGSNILDGIRSRFGIDRIEISHGTGAGLEDVSLQIGKYFTRGLYIALNKGITSASNRIILEAALRPNLKLQAEISDTAEGELHLKWRHDY